MQVSIITSLFNRLDLTRVYLKSLARTLQGWRYEVILIDDGSTDDTREFLRELPSEQYRCVLNESPRGFAANNNTGAQMARAPLLCMLNNDLVLTNNWLYPMTRLAQLVPDVACVGNVQREPVGGLIDHYGVYFDHENSGQHAGKNSSLAPEESYLQWPAVTAACWAIRKKVFLELGGFDEAFRNGFEDVDFCLRAGTRGYRHFVANHSVIYHHISASPTRVHNEEANSRLIKNRWHEFIANESRMTRTRGGERQKGRHYLQKILRHPQRLNFWRFTRALEQSVSLHEPKRQLDFLPRTLFLLQDFLLRRNFLENRVEAGHQTARVFMLVGDTVQTASRAGVPTLVRSLAGAFGRLRAPVRLVVWQQGTQSLELLPAEFSVGVDAEALRVKSSLFQSAPSAPSLYSPLAAACFKRSVPASALHDLPAADVPANAWILVPEVLYHQRTAQLIEYVHRHGWRLAVIFHDAAATNEPQLFPKEVPHQHALYMRAICAADLLLPVSDFAANDWDLFASAKKLARPAAQICKPGADTFVHARGDKPYRPVPSKTVRILCVSAVTPRKGHVALLAAYDLVAAARPDMEITLSLVGEHRSGGDQIAAAIDNASTRHRGRITWREWVDYSTLRRYYEACDFTVYPSVLEGFGLPILESLWFERPCVCANFGAMDETSYGGGCLRVDVRDPSILAAAILSLIDQPDQQQRLADEARARRLQTWEGYAKEVLESMTARIESRLPTDQDRPYSALST